MTDQNPGSPSQDPREEMPPPPPPPPLPPPPPPPPGYASGQTSVTPSRAVEIPGVGAVPLASMLERLIGALIDALILFVPTILVTALLPDLINSLGSIAISAAYFIYFLGAKGATIGGRVMNIKCVRADTGGLPDFDRAGRRWLLLFGPSVLPFFGGLITVVIGFSPLWDGNRRMQGYHDKWAGTYVVKTGANSPIQQEASVL